MPDFEKQTEEQSQVALAIPEKQGIKPNRVSTENKLLHPDMPPVFLFLKQTTWPRNWFIIMTLSPWFDIFSALVVVLSCAILALHNPDESAASEILEVLESITFLYFIVEMFVRVLARGIYGYEGSYLKNNWNKFDFIINFGEVLDYFLSFFRFHVFEVIRPLRLISKVQSLRILVGILLETMPMFANLLILYTFVIHIFAVVGVQLWAGSLRYRCFLGEDVATKYNVTLSPYYVPERGQPFICSPEGKHGLRRCHDVPVSKTPGCTFDDHDEHASEAIISAAMITGPGSNSCVNWNSYYNVCRPGDINPYRGAINFDNIGFAWITVFQVVTLKGWTDIMFLVMDAHSFWNFLFFILATCMGSFIMMNVCAVVIATKFSENKEKLPQEAPTGVSFSWLYGNITAWLQGIISKWRNSRKVHPYGNYSKSESALVQSWIQFKRKMKRIVHSLLFDQLIMFAVLISILCMVMEHHGQPKELTYVLHICNVILTVVFVLEMIMKLIALSWWYFMDLNNLFDFAIVVISVWELVSETDSKLSVMRAFRVLRFVKLVHFMPYLKSQLMIMKRTLKEAAALCRLLLFVIFLFSIAGMLLFAGKIKTAETGEVPRKNFDSLLWSMVTVFQILTLQDWNFALYDAMAATTPLAAIYFAVLIALGKHVLLNVVVGIVLQSFKSRPPVEVLNSSPSLCESSTSSESTATLSETNIVNQASEEATTETKKDNIFLNRLQKVRQWCKDHEEWSMYMLSPENRFRICCQRVISHRMFDNAVLFFILFSCITIAMERPGLDPKGLEHTILIICGHVFSLVFFFEMLFKVLAKGLLFGKRCYCHSYWNMVDGFLVVLSLVQFIVSLTSSGKNSMLGILKVLRLLRTLRPLRVIKRAPTLKLAVEALIASMKPIWNIVIISCVFIFLYAILAVQLFKGKFFYCVGQNTRNITNKTDCLSANYRWTRKTYNFDNVPQALMTLFVMYSRDAWVELMYDGLDAVGEDKQPRRNHNEWMIIFFVSFVVGSFFLLDMFIGVMVETFQECQRRQKKGHEVEEILPKEELKDGEPEKMPYYTYYSPLRRQIHTLCTSNFLDLFMTVVIVLSVFMMAFQHYKQPRYVQLLMEYSYFVFTAILIIEVLLKFVAFGVWRFLQINWNLLDVMVALVSIVSMIFAKLNMTDVIPINPSILRVCRVLRLAQVLKAKKIQVLLKTIVKTLSQVGSICLLFMLFFFIYAVLGIELFGRLECNTEHPCLGLNRYISFKHFGFSLLTLYQVCTGDNWGAIMKDTLRQCFPTETDCPSYLSWVSPIYFSSFVILAQFVLVNLVVAFIMQALEDSSERQLLLQCIPPEGEEGEEGEVQSADKTQLSPGEKVTTS